MGFVIYLQIFLSNKENKILGLILPILSFFISLLLVMGQYAYDSMQTGAGVFIHILTGLLIANIPTVILLLIYFAIREKTKINKEIEKMSIKDLH